MGLTGNFCEDDNEEINTYDINSTGNSMSKEKAKRIIKVCQTQTYGDRVYSDREYKEARQVVSRDEYDPI